MADPSVVKEWLERADEDFRFAETNLRDGSEFLRVPGLCLKMPVYEALP